MMRLHLTDSLPRNVWPNCDFRDELFRLSEKGGSIDSSEESQRLRRHFRRFSVSFQNFYNVPPTEDLDLVDHARDGMVKSEELTDKDEALTRAVHRLRRVRFHQLLSIEAQRLNCPKNEVLSLERYPTKDSTQSIYHCHLTQDILWRVLGKLELIDLVRVSGVCKDWRILVWCYVSQVERLEYCLSTHLLRFRSWLHNTCHSELEWLSTSWNKTALELTSWTTNLALNLKTLIVNWPIAWDDFVAVSERCLNLKHFVCEYNDALFINKLHELKPQFISKLESFVVQHSGVLTAPNASILNLSVHSSLTVYSIIRRREDVPGMLGQYVQLLNNWTMVPTRSLQQFHCFRLKYLRLGFKSQWHPQQTEHLGHCLENCPELLVLILEDESLVGHHVLTSIAKGCQKLKAVWITMSSFSPLSSIKELVSIHESLLRYDPNAKFEEFHFVLWKGQLKMIKNRVPFNLIDRVTRPKTPDRFSVKHPFIKNIIGTPF